MTQNFRIALCLHGLAGGKNSKGRAVRGDYGYKCFEKELLNKYNVDIFAHSWSTNIKEQVIDWYHPKKYMFEESKNYISDPDFNDAMDLIRNAFCQTLIKKVPNKSEDGKEQMCCYCRKMKKISQLTDPTKRICTMCYYYFKLYYKNLCSLYYSYWKTNELKKQYEQENGFVYDLVITSRYDMWLGQITDLSNLNPNKFYFLNYETGKTHKILDHVFISSSDNIDFLCGIYPDLLQYTSQLIKIGSHNQYLNHDIIELRLKEGGLLEQIEPLAERFPGGALSTMKPDALDIFLKDKCPHLFE